MRNHLCLNGKEYDNMKYNLEVEKEKFCWLYKYNCHCRTGGCYGLPDNGCPVYRWFKLVIKYQKERGRDEE